jgi:4-diphosphocytidyl-2-C-methyl-D-erythritol kinase
MIRRRSPSTLHKAKGLILNSYAKVNLYLEVLNKRPDGYHNLDTLFERISLTDTIILDPLANKEIRISCDSPLVPADSSNLAYKSAKLLSDGFDVDRGVAIKIIKRIPVGSGMGGGSSNAAATLLGLNTLWNLKLSRHTLVEYAKKIGADVPFFIYDTPFARGQARGDEIKPIRALKKHKFWHILVVPRIKVSTPLIFRKWDECTALKISQKRRLTIPQQNVKILTSALKDNNLSLISKTLCNDLEHVTAKLYPDIGRIKETLTGMGVKAVLMSGSGPAVYGFVSSGKEAVVLCRQLERNRFWQVIATHTL